MLLTMLTLGFSQLMPPLLFLDGLIGDMTFVLKIFVLMTIVSYVVQHLGKGPLALLVIAVMAWFIIFDYFIYFGGIYILYMLALFGGVQLAMDFFIVGPQMLAGGQHGAGQEGEGEHMTGLELKEKQHQMMQMRKRAGF